MIEQTLMLVYLLVNLSMLEEISPQDNHYGSYVNLRFRLAVKYQPKRKLGKKGKQRNR